MHKKFGYAINVDWSSVVLATGGSPAESLVHLLESTPVIGDLTSDNMVTTLDEPQRVQQRQKQLEKQRKTLNGYFQSFKKYLLQAL